MSETFTPRLDILPPPQLQLWPELGATPDYFTLYGGTAIALRLGHRQSVDFDFFARQPFEPSSLLGQVPYLRDASVRQSTANTLTASIERGGTIQLSFFGDLGLGQVAPAETVEGPEISVAALIDVAGTKVAVVTQRAELRDYLDIHALLTKARISLPEMLAAGLIIYGNQFSPLLALKAISYHEDAGLSDLPQAIRRDLTRAVANSDPQRLPKLSSVRKCGDGT
jgi:hypothetical protein